MKSLNHQNELRQFRILLLMILISFVGMSMAYPIFPPLFLHPTQAFPELFNTSETIRKMELGIALAVNPLGQFLGSPILSGCSDRYGRKIVLILSLMGSIFGLGMTGLALTLGNLPLLIFSRFLTGATEGILPIARAMATDLKSLNKLRSLGKINGLAAMGYILGPMLGGTLSDAHFFSWASNALPFWVAMGFSILAMSLGFYRLEENRQERNMTLSIWQRFFLWTRFKALLNENQQLKNIILVSTIFTFSIDIFYEFGSVYLTQLWKMGSFQLALYNGALCAGLMLGSTWLCAWFSNHFPLKKTTFFSMGTVAFIFLLLASFPNPMLAAILFFGVGLNISMVNTNISVQVTEAAPSHAQGEAMGTQYSLRMLGDALICVLGGFLIISSAILPILICALIASWAVIQYRRARY